MQPSRSTWHQFSTPATAGLYLKSCPLHNRRLPIPDKRAMGRDRVWSRPSKGFIVAPLFAIRNWGVAPRILTTPQNVRNLANFGLFGRFFANFSKKRHYFWLKLCSLVCLPPLPRQTPGIPWDNSKIWEILNFDPKNRPFLAIFSRGRHSHSFRNIDMGPRFSVAHFWRSITVISGIFLSDTTLTS